jgi:hypothetical protein
LPINGGDSFQCSALSFKFLTLDAGFLLDLIRIIFSAGWIRPRGKAGKNSLIFFLVMLSFNWLCRACTPTCFPGQAEESFQFCALLQAPSTTQLLTIKNSLP